MQRLLGLLTLTRWIAIIGILTIAASALITSTDWQSGVFWAAIIVGVALVLWFAISMVKRLRSHRASRKLASALESDVAAAAPSDGSKAPAPARPLELDELRKRLMDTVKKIKTSKLGQMSGSRALYELPWYIVIGNPAAGKSSAILNSGLQFPFAGDGHTPVQGVGGTRNCDWFFSTEGILLDTAGRYSVSDEDRSEWIGFLGLLKRYRPRAPINGIIVTASIAELTGNSPEFTIKLANNLRQRVQELTEKLEVFAPVYVMFTKADLITGFTEFFSGGNCQEYERVWGASFPYEPNHRAVHGTTPDIASAYTQADPSAPPHRHEDAQPRVQSDVVAMFDRHFDELHDGLKEISLAQIALNRNGALSPGQLSFPLEFSAIKPALRAFLATLFDSNPFQYRPVFRGFYFSSALREGIPNGSAGERIAERFSLNKRSLPDAEPSYSEHGFFLRDFFSKVVFADRKTVRQYASPLKMRARYVSFFGMVAVLGLALGAWTWSAIGNQQLTANVQADLDKVARLQQTHVDLRSRLEGMDMLADRIEQLEQYHHTRPLSLSFGLYQGDRLEQRLLDEYYAGVKQLLLSPVASNLSAFLADVNAHASQLTPINRMPQAPNASVNVHTELDPAPHNKSGLYADASPVNVQDAYNALKTYLMLGDKTHVETAHLTDQLARFWRGWLETNRGAMPREDMIRSAERLITFYLSRINDDNWPMIDDNLALVDQTRSTLRRVVSGMPARERVYDAIKARASTRFAPMTVARIVGRDTPGDTALLAGSYAIPGTFTRDAWSEYVQPAIRDAATKELQAKDWVLDSVDSNDLTLDGSPEQIQKMLVGMYKTEYAKQWQQFMTGITVQNFRSFGQSVDAINRLGDPQDSPIKKLLETAYEQTSWDNPSLVNVGLPHADTGMVARIKGWFSKRPAVGNAMSRAGASGHIGIDGKAVAVPMGPVGAAFAGLGRIVMRRQDGSLLQSYMTRLSKVRSRFDTLKNQGEPGPGAKQLMQQTLDGNGSELSDSLKFVDEQMLTGLDDAQRNALRPLLVRPLMQAYAVVMQPASNEINKIWEAQVYQPFAASLANKYPFDANGKVEAAPSEIAQVFGPEGSISKFVTATLGPLAVRRGDVLTARTWGDMGLSLTPAFVNGFSTWVAPLSGGASGGSASGNTGGNGGSVGQPQTVFQILPEPSSGTTEYTITIDGQQLRYRNTPPQWANFVWPNANGQPGARLDATTFDGRTISLFNQPGGYGLEKLLHAAQRKRRDDGTFDLTWTQQGVSVTARMRIISSAQPASAGNGDGAGGQSLLGMTLPPEVTAQATPGSTSASLTTSTSASTLAPPVASTDGAATVESSPSLTPSTNPNPGGA